MRRLLPMLVLLALAGGGCTLSGGSIPIGRPPGRVAGTVVHAVAPYGVVAGATVTVLDARGQARRAVTDKDGAFAIEDVAPGEASIVALREAAAAAPGHAVTESVRLEARVDPGVTVSVVLALLPEDLHGEPGSGPAIAQPAGGVTVEIGDQQALQVKPGTSGGSALAPSYVVEGGVGTIGPDGVFHATAAGTGTIRVISGDVEDSRPITVVL